MVDSTSQGLPGDGRRSGDGFRRAGSARSARLLREVDLTALERLIARNGFVERVAAYVSGRGSCTDDHPAGTAAAIADRRAECLCDA